MYKPVWEGSVEGFSKNQIRKNLWKFQALDYEFEDLLHEAVICFCHCKLQYEVETPQHFMALFKTALHNRFYDLAQIARIEREGTFEGTVEIQGVCDSEGPFMDLMKRAPEEVKQVLSLVLYAPKELLESIGFNRKKDKGFSANARLCKLLGYNPKSVNLVQMVKSHFQL